MPWIALRWRCALRLHRESRDVCQGGNVHQCVRMYSTRPQYAISLLLVAAHLLSEGVYSQTLWNSYQRVSRMFSGISQISMVQSFTLERFTSYRNSRWGISWRLECLHLLIKYMAHCVELCGSKASLARRYLSHLNGLIVSRAT